MAEYKFVKDLPDDYLCMICAKVLNEPHLTDCCGQHFCQACLEQWFKKQERKICPHCRSESFSHISYIPLKRKIKAVEVYCPNQAEGCMVITKLGELDSHKNECGFAKVVCSQGCGKSILRKDMTQHCSQKCSKRKMICIYCGKIDHYETIYGKHTTTCEEYPVKCPRGCSAGGIKRKNLVKHAKICPLEEVQCPFNEAGCDATVLRKDLGAHMETSTQQHLMNMMAAYCKIQEDLKQMSSRVVGLTPVKLTDENDSFSFIITSNQGWISPPFCVQDGYTFCIKHKEGKEATLVLLKGKNDDNLKWPMNLEYFIAIYLEMQHTTTVQTKKSMVPPPQAHKQILKFDLLANLERVAVSDCDTEVANMTLPEEESLNSKIKVRLLRYSVLDTSAAQLRAFLT